MKRLIYLLLLFPAFATAQVNGTIQKTPATGVVRGNFGSSGLDTLERKDRFIHLRDYNPDPTGVTSSNTAFTNAIAAAKAKRVSLFIDDGTYLVTTPITVNNFYKQIFGNNVTIRTSNDIRILNISDSEGIEVKGLRLVGDRGTTSQIGLFLKTSNKSHIQVKADSLGYGIMIDSTSAQSGQVRNSLINVEGSTVYKSKYGIYVKQLAEYVRISNSTFSSNDSIGAYLIGGNFSFNGNTSVYNRTGVKVEGIVGAGTDHGHITGNTINHNSVINLHIKDIQYSATVTGNDIWASGEASSYGIFLENSSAVNISGNTIANNPVNIGFQSSDNNLISANTLVALNGFTTAQIKEFGATLSYNNTISPNNFKYTGAVVDSVSLLAGSRLGGSALFNKFIKSGGTSSQFLKADGSVDATAYGTGSVTSITPGFGFTSSTPITTSGTLVVDTASAITGRSRFAAAMDLKANLASPTFTGTPTLPTGTIAVTQTAGDNTTAVATTAFVTTADNLKANIASPTFTGDITASGRILQTTTSSPNGQGQMGWNSTGGFYIWPKAGSTSDVTLYSSSGNPVVEVPTGTTTIKLAAPTTSAGSYDALTRNTSTGVVEKVAMASGTYTPTLSAALNCTTGTAEPAYYQRMGDIVRVSGTIAGLTITAGATSTGFEISLPIARNFTVSNQLTLNGSNNGQQFTIGVSGNAETVNDTAIVRFTPSSTASAVIHYDFTYTL